ncbi:hypothetical protein YC2023_114548 [Brassica napus]
MPHVLLVIVLALIRERAIWHTLSWEHHECASHGSLPLTTKLYGTPSNSTILIQSFWITLSALIFRLVVADTSSGRA